MRRILGSFALLVVKLACIAIFSSGCATPHANCKAYPPPNLAKQQLACVLSDLRVEQIDGQSKSARGSVYVKNLFPTAYDLLPGEHTFLLFAGKNSWTEPGTHVAGADVVYCGRPVKLTLKASLEAGKNYAVHLRIDRPRLALWEITKSEFGFPALKRTITDVVLKEDGRVVATAVPAQPWSDAE
jgi:hypothetical protein